MELSQQQPLGNMIRNLLWNRMHEAARNLCTEYGYHPVK